MIISKHDTTWPLGIYFRLLIVYINMVNGVVVGPFFLLHKVGIPILENHAMYGLKFIDFQPWNGNYCYYPYLSLP